MRVRSLLVALAFSVLGLGFANPFGFYLAGDLDGPKGVGAFYQVFDPLYLAATYASYSGVSGLVVGASYHVVDVPLRKVLDRPELPPLDAYLGVSLSGGYFKAPAADAFALGAGGFLGSRLWVGERWAVFLEFGLGPSVTFYSGSTYMEFSESLLVGVELF